MNNGGDCLARGQRKAQFPPAKVSQDRWDEIFLSDEEIKARNEKLLKSSLPKLKK